ncbi:carbon storage regulator CsrA [Paenibacillus sp. KACC 21273]|uniref:carbon storage regulator CsrA n=1 Tax=Paenibacillus sp. KACC 21273 TaxID=3025665 RepID=UPI002366BC75|nr:carbon storage regulator CsrA [Paenibacillus sp. KACC 21273]WDF51474.1 carbon storage regulator CsrA [Paenibacillus sp. KACC 21273]
MLVLGRKKGEKIIIQNDIEVTVLSVDGDTVKLGISAPAHIDIYREEIYVAIQESNQASATPQVEQVNALVNLFNQNKNKS